MRWGDSLVSCAVGEGALECCHQVVQWTGAAGLSRSPVIGYWLTCGLLMNVIRGKHKMGTTLCGECVGGVYDVMYGLGRWES